MTAKPPQLSPPLAAALAIATSERRVPALDVEPRAAAEELLAALADSRLGEPWDFPLKLMINELPPEIVVDVGWEWFPLLAGGHAWCSVAGACDRLAPDYDVTPLALRARALWNRRGQTRRDYIALAVAIPDRVVRHPVIDDMVLDDLVHWRRVGREYGDDRAESAVWLARRLESPATLAALVALARLPFRRERLFDYLRIEALEALAVRATPAQIPTLILEVVLDPESIYVSLRAATEALARLGALDELEQARAGGETAIAELEAAEQRWLDAQGVSIDP